MARPAPHGLRLFSQVDDLRTGPASEGRGAAREGPTGARGAPRSDVSRRGQVKLAKLESEGVFTASNEGKYEGKAGTHVPTVSNDGTTVTIKVPNGSDENDFVTRAPAPPVARPPGRRLSFSRYLYAKREGAVVFYKEFKAGDVRRPRPVSPSGPESSRARRKRRSRSRRARGTPSRPSPRSA